MKSNEATISAFIEVGKEILTHPLFLSQRNYKHHTSSLFHHIIAVAYLSYKWAKVLGLDCESVVRGALLHDFFLYDWHVEGKKIKKRFLKKHGFTHAKEAYRNADFLFKLNAKEKDIILKHMFPLNIKAPLYLESWLVNTIDNVVTFKEYFTKKVPDYVWAIEAEILMSK